MGKETEVTLAPFELLGKLLAWSLLAFVGMPVVNILLAATGGWIVQHFWSTYIVIGGAELGLHLNPGHIWMLSVFLGYAGSYVRMPIAPGTTKHVSS